MERTIKPTLDKDGNIILRSRELRLPRKFGQVSIAGAKLKTRKRIQNIINEKIKVKYEDVGVRIGNKSEAALAVALLAKSEYKIKSNLVKIGVATANPKRLLDKAAYYALSQKVGVPRDFGFLPKVLSKLVKPNPYSLRLLFLLSRLAEKLDEKKEKAKQACQNALSSLAKRGVLPLPSTLSAGLGKNTQEQEEDNNNGIRENYKAEGDGRIILNTKKKILTSEEAYWLMIMEIIFSLYRLYPSGAEKDETEHFFKRRAGEIIKQAERVASAIAEKIMNERKRASLPLKTGKKAKKLENYPTSGNIFVQKTHPKNKKVLIAYDISGSMMVNQINNTVMRLFFITIAHELVKQLNGDIAFFNSEFPKKRQKDTKQLVTKTKNFLRRIGAIKNQEQYQYMAYIRDVQDSSSNDEIFDKGGGGESGIVELFTYHKPHEYDAVVLITDSEWCNDTYKQLTKKVKMIGAQLFYFIEVSNSEAQSIYRSARCSKCGAALKIEKLKVDEATAVKKVRSGLGRTLPRQTVFLPFFEEDLDKGVYSPIYCSSCAVDEWENTMGFLRAYARGMTQFIRNG